MMNEKNLRFAAIVLTILLHLGVIIFVVFETDIIIREKPEEPRILRLIDLDEVFPELPQFQSVLPPQPQPQPETQMQLQPLPQPPPSPIFFETEIPLVEEIAEIMIEADPIPEQEIVPAGTLIIPVEAIEAVDHDVTSGSYDIFLSTVQVTSIPLFDEAALAADLVYPAIALRSGIEGRVILELFVDRTGTVLRVDILLEDPQNRGFGEAAVSVFTGRKGTPAYANGEPVSCRIRRPVTFRITR
ncbi:MAG: energy transducer TonB [Treponema sp.]|nr:energy transducer TonB [Treponema sp.]